MGEAAHLDDAKLADVPCCAAAWETCCSSARCHQADQASCTLLSAAAQCTYSACVSGCTDQTWCSADHRRLSPD